MSVRLSHLRGCTGFWLWALVGAAGTFGLVDWFFLIPAVGIGYLVQRREGWRDGPVLVGLLTGAGFPLIFVAALHWNEWHHRIAGDNTPNPYDWGVVGLALVFAGIVAYAVKRERA